MVGGQSDMPSRQPDLPNVLIILTDQQSSWTVGAYGATEIQTPNIDRIANEGARLSSYFVNVACCTPSRGCFFTGLYPHRHGAPFNDIPLRRDVTTLAHRLRDAGYATAYVGKWHLDGDRQSLAGALSRYGGDSSLLAPRESDWEEGERARWLASDRSMGFDDCRWMFNCSHAKKVDEHLDGTATIVAGEIGDERTYMTDWLTTRSLEFVRQSRKNPFFLVLSIPDPHDPFSVRAPFDSMFQPDDLTVPATFHQQDVPAWLNFEWVRYWHNPPAVVGSDENLRRAKAQYLGEVACIDHNVGRILAALEESGAIDDTIVVFATDHGEYMGEHGVYAKNLLYETAYHVPFLVRYPALIEPATVVDQFVSAVDVQQTLLGLLSVSPSGAEQGRDASPLLLGRSTAWDDEVFIYGTAYDRAGIITPEYEMAYVRQGVDHILFDRSSDPLQVKNLFYDASYAEVVASLTQRLLAHNRAIEAPEAAWLQTEARGSIRPTGSSLTSGTPRS